MNLIIRGHIRSSLSNDGLRMLVEEMHKKKPVNIFIHTWENQQSSVSWRTMRDDPTPVSEDLVRSYFGRMSDSIKTVVVDSEEDVVIGGRNEGVVASSWAPILGYKRMFYGMMRGAELVAEKAEPDEMSLQMRFDALSNWASFKKNQILDFLDQRPEEWERIRFMIRPASSGRELELRFDRWTKWGPEYEPHWTTGVDNIYMASVKDMRDFLRHMYLNLDSVNDKYRSFIHQEWITMFEAFDPVWMKP